jgi:sugar lactone lactonase YvrE
MGLAGDADWKLYRNVPTGLSFRYPPSMEFRERDPRRSGMPDTDAIVDQVEAHGPQLRFVVYHDGATAFQPIDNACKPIRLGGQEAALECVMCWPACFWAVEVMSPRLCSISGSSEVLEDSAFPLRSIVRTVRFLADDGTTSAHPIEASAQPLVKATGNAIGAGVFVTNYSREVTKQPQGNIATAYSLTGTGNDKPVAVISRLPYGRGIAVDPQGYIYIASEGMNAGGASVKVFPPDSGDIVALGPTDRDVTGFYFPGGIAIDAHANLYVTSDNGTINRGGSNVDSVIVYPAGSKGNAKPIATIAGHDTGLRDPYGVAVDAKGNIYVANVANFESGPSGSGSITIYRSGSNGNVKPIGTIAGPDTGLHDPVGVAVDCSGNIYVANYEGGPSESGSVTVYKPGSDGDAKPERTITGVDSGIRQPYGVALDSDRNIYVANYTGGESRTGSVAVYGADANGGAKPSRIIAGADSGIDYPWGIATRPYQCTAPEASSR